MGSYLCSLTCCWEQRLRAATFTLGLCQAGVLVPPALRSCCGQPRVCSRSVGSGDFRITSTEEPMACSAPGRLGALVPIDVRGREPDLAEPPCGSRMLAFKQY